MVNKNTYDNLLNSGLLKQSTLNLLAPETTPEEQEAEAGMYNTAVNPTPNFINQTPVVGKIQEPLAMPDFRLASNDPDYTTPASAYPKRFKTDDEVDNEGTIQGTRPEQNKEMPAYDEYAGSNIRETPAEKAQKQSEKSESDSLVEINKERQAAGLAPVTPKESIEQPSTTSNNTTTQTKPNTPPTGSQQRASRLEQFKRDKDLIRKQEKEFLFGNKTPAVVKYSDQDKIAMQTYGQLLADNKISPFTYDQLLNKIKENATIKPEVVQKGLFDRKSEILTQEAELARQDIKERIDLTQKQKEYELSRVDGIEKLNKIRLADEKKILDDAKKLNDNPLAEFQKMSGGEKALTIISGILTGGLSLALLYDHSKDILATRKKEAYGYFDKIKQMHEDERQGELAVHAAKLNLFKLAADEQANKLASKGIDVTEKKQQLDNEFAKMQADIQMQYDALGDKYTDLFAAKGGGSGAKGLEKLTSGLQQAGKDVATSGANKFYVLADTAKQTAKEMRDAGISRLPSVFTDPSSFMGEKVNTPAQNKALTSVRKLAQDYLVATTGAAYTDDQLEGTMELFGRSPEAMDRAAQMLLDQAKKTENEALSGYLPDVREVREANKAEIAARNKPAQNNIPAPDKRPAK